LDHSDDTDDDDEIGERERYRGSESDQLLLNAATIGTSLMVVNSHRTMVIL
jgi:hypothetical protein